MIFLKTVLWLSVKWALKHHVIDKVVDELVDQLNDAVKRSDNQIDDAAAKKIEDHSDDIKDWLKGKL
jgi:hypothetical protein